MFPPMLLQGHKFFYGRYVSKESIRDEAQTGKVSESPYVLVINLV